MKLAQYIDRTKFFDKSEIEKVKFLAYFILRIENIPEFNVSNICERLTAVGCAKVNKHRLSENVKKSKAFIKGSISDTYKLTVREIGVMDVIVPDISEKTEDVVNEQSILPETLYTNTRGYIENLAKQINACYENNIFDGCAVLMRRLIEILIILGYKHLGRLSEISEGIGYKNLNNIINYTISNKVFDLSKETQEALNDFRELGNFSAHKIHYNSKRGDINNIKNKFRLAFEELLYACKLRH